MANEEPPCGTCNRPVLDKENDTAWRIWALLAGFDRPVLAGVAGAQRLTLRAVDVFNICEKYQATIADAEKVLLIEDTAFPLLQAKWEAASTTTEDPGA